MVPWVGNIMTPVYPHFFEIFPETQISIQVVAGFKYFLFFTPKIGEMIHFDEHHIFQMGWVETTN